MARFKFFFTFFLLLSTFSFQSLPFYMKFSKGLRIFYRILFMLSILTEVSHFYLRVNFLCNFDFFTETKCVLAKSIFLQINYFLSWIYCCLLKADFFQYLLIRNKVAQKSHSYFYVLSLFSTLILLCHKYTRFRKFGIRIFELTTVRF